LFPQTYAGKNNTEIHRGFRFRELDGEHVLLDTLFFAVQESTLAQIV
jgi:hypothetical protein